MRIKRLSFLIILVLVSTVSNAQFYISGTGGYSFKSNEKVLGEDISTSGIDELKGSFGTGLRGQIRAGYTFNEKIGIELGLGYLHGSNNDITKILGVNSLPEGNVEGRGRAFGTSLSGVFNLTKNFYVRAGLLTKLGGRTITDGKVIVKDLPVFVFDPSVENVGVFDDLAMQFTTDFYGKLPFGAIGSAGYKFEISKNLNLFAEVEYMGINIARDKSKLSDFSASIAGEDVTRDEVVSFMNSLLVLPVTPDDTKEVLREFLPLLNDEVKWGEGNFQAPKAPYSSLGFNIGITYTFSK